ncbi:MAG: DUF2723 domain-containing protein [Bacteroidales bacterium]|nr:DUF2723 domain-containing protein [Bacteroidales bacterium]MCF8456722.1 DUF2723 domain-containing protein [Bacteroidales bacterium]
MTKQFKLYNTVFGWLGFLIAFIVYMLTIEPTTSYWDCGEFIATAFKLEVGHPPGAPLFMILARFFSLFAGDQANVPYLINSMSALASAFTILFLFWTITHIARKIIISDGDYSVANTIAVLGSGFVGAMAYTFSDTFWFSAVEAEVYASSSLFTALVFWCILKWEEQFDSPYANRWIIFIAYLVGLSIGVHLLNLLAIPAIVFVYYFKKYKTSSKGIVFASLLSIVILGAIMYGIIPGIIKVAALFELFFVNGIGLPFNSGLIVYVLLLVGGVVYGLYYSYQNKKYVLNMVLLAFSVILIGYSSFTMIVIRSMANPPMDENNPENVFALLSYLNREQYGDRPLVYGPYYNAPMTGSEKGSSTYIKKDGKYVESYVREETLYDKRFETFFPRMWSRQDSHIRGYKQWGKIKGRAVEVKGEKEYVPTFGENLRYFFTYQLGHMYFRYFMWNFAGRQNDVQGHGGIMNGNWISGIPFLDKNMVGNQAQLTDYMKNRESRNTLYLLPLLLGIIGALFLYTKNQKDFWIVMLLFIFTGIAIVVYLNQYPYQPRERDYAYAGSFYAFTIWIGLGVLAVIKAFQNILSRSVSAVIGTVLCLACVPGIMASENWDDHDRSGRYTARDFAYNYLNTCKPNALLFTFGDNDTFPLWYAQEVEGIRTDVRVVNMSLLSTDWYINQMKAKAYDSEPVATSLEMDQYIQGTRDQVFMFDRFKDYTDISKLMEFVGSDDPATKVRVTDDLFMDYFPSKLFRLPVPKEKVLANGTVSPELADQIVDNVDWKIGRNSLLKGDMMMIDILAKNNWERPVYFAVSAQRSSYLGLHDYFQLEGLAYRLVPIKTTGDENTIGRVDTDILYNKLMNEFKWGRMNEPDFYMDENNARLISIMDVRNTFARLTMQLIIDNKKDSAIAVVDKCIEVLPNSKIPFDQFMISFAKAYYLCGATEKGNELSRTITNNFFDELDYYFSLEGDYFDATERERNIASQVISLMVEMAYGFKQDELAKEFQAKINTRTGGVGLHGR